VARRDAASPVGPPPPTALRPVIRFNRLPQRALSTVRDVVDHDEAFRTHVADSTDLSGLDRPSLLFLTRPDGWVEELELLADAAAEDTARERAERDEVSALRRVDQLEELVARLRDEAATARTESDAAIASAEFERKQRHIAEGRLVESDERAAAIESERQRAVAQLKAAEALADNRLAEQRLLSGRVESLRAELAAADAARPQVEPEAIDERSDDSHHPLGRPDAASPPIDRVQLGEIVGRAAGAASELSAALEAARALVSTDRPAPAVADEPLGPTPGPPRAPAGGAAARRRPVRLVRGVVDGTVEAADQLLRFPNVVVFVDGYNVSMSAWPSLDRGGQRDQLVTVLANLRRRTGAEIHVVFDGDDDGARPSVSQPLPVRVHFSAADVEADDVLIEFAGRIPPDRPVVVVSSDRRVRQGARAAGANVIGSEQLLELARS